MRSHFTSNVKKLTDAVLFSKRLQGDNTEFFFTDDFLIASLSPADFSEEISCEHSHDDYEFLVPTSFIPNVFTDEYSMLGDVNTVYAFVPDRKHGIKFNISECSYYSIAVNRTYFDSICKTSPGGSIPLAPSFRCSARLMSMINFFEEEFKKADYTDIRNILDPLKKIICAEIINLSNMSARDPDIKSSGKKGLKFVTDYILENYTKDISVKELAEMCSLTPSYFCVCFKNAFGESPKNYITKLRIEKAQILLKSTDKHITEIASLCGFNRFNTFSLAFRQFSNDLSPGEYRKMNTE